MAERSRRSKVQQPAVNGDSLFFVEEDGTGGTARSGGRSSTKRRRRPPTDSTRASKKACSSKEDVVFDPSTIRVGDDVMVRAHQPGEPPYVARVVGLGSKGQIKLRWFYRPEDLGHGRQVRSNHPNTPTPRTLPTTSAGSRRAQQADSPPPTHTLAPICFV